MAAPTKILFIRHADAVEAGDWTRDDMSRPLTARGKKYAKKLFAFLYECGAVKMDVVSSEATRARETAGLFSRQLGGKVVISSILNPGARTAEILSVIRAQRPKAAIALCGHEPDFSRAIAEIIGGKNAQIKLAKASCALVEMETASRGSLRWIVPPLPMIGKSTKSKFQ